MKRTVLLVVAMVFVLSMAAAPAFANTCAFRHGLQSTWCMEKLADVPPAGKCAYYQWKHVRCHEAKPAPVAAPKVEKIQKGEKLVLEGIYFDTGSSKIKAESFAVLDSNAQKIKNSGPDLNIVIVGYTDDRGSDKLNEKLSAARATSVKNYLVGKGVVASQIKAEGRGKANPIADNKTDAGRAKNRRIELEAK